MWLEEFPACFGMDICSFTDQELDIGKTPPLDGYVESSLACQSHTSVHVREQITFIYMSLLQLLFCVLRKNKESDGKIVLKCFVTAKNGKDTHRENGIRQEKIKSNSSSKILRKASPL